MAKFRATTLTLIPCMLNWLKNLGKSGDGSDWRNAGLPSEELQWLEGSFLPLAPLKAGIVDRVMEFVVLGSGEDVLREFKGLPAASGALALRTRTHFSMERPSNRDKFFSSTTILDPAFHRRLGLVLHAASQYPGRKEVCTGLQDGAEFLDTYIWEAARCEPNFYPRRAEPPQLTAREFETMLELNGNPPSWIVRAALVIDTTHWGWGSHSGSLFPTILGFLDSLIRHRGMVRECLNQTDHRAKIHAMEVLQKAGFSVSHLPDAAALLAVNSAKGVREAAHAWIQPDPASVLPELRRIATEGSPDERLHAVKMLSMLDANGSRSFFEERAPLEKSRKVSELIESILHSPSEADFATDEGAAASLELPPVPDVLADQSLDDSVLADLRDCFEKVNVLWRAEWERNKGKKWNPQKPPELTDDAAKEWFALLQSMDATSKVRHKLPQQGNTRLPALCEFCTHSKFRTVHVLRWCALINRYFLDHPTGYMHEAGLCLTARIRERGPIDYREMAEICRRLGFPSEWIGMTRLMSGPYSMSVFSEVPAELAWPYFAERLVMLEEALGWRPPVNAEQWPSYWNSMFRANAWRILAGFPTPPPAFLDRMWEVALGSTKTERPLAQEALLRAPNRDARLIAALGSGLQDQRTSAADWAGRLKLKKAIPVLRTAVAKEKHEAAKAAMIGALERLGVSPDEFLDREGLLRDSTKLLAKGIPAALQWFPFANLPAVHWSDTGKLVAPDILKAWLVQTCKFKAAEPSALLRRYAAGLRVDEREALGQFLLDAWIAEDVKPHTRDEAEKLAMSSAQSFHQSAARHPQYYPEYVGMTLEQIYARTLPAQLEIPQGSATDSKGVLALAAACTGADASVPIARYVKKWYGTRVHQAKALLQVLAWVDHPSATQSLLAIGTRFRTKSLQQEATRLAEQIAERKGWSLAELADRTIPTAGLDENGSLELDYGPRQFYARLDQGMNFVLFDAEDKPLKSLPDPRKDDDEEKAAAAKKQFAASRKELKQLLEQQRMNLYEAMCVQRRWAYDDWEAYLNRHPVMRHYCQRLVWLTQCGEDTLTFRPLPDGTLTDVEDNSVTLSPDHIISLAHQMTTSSEIGSKWLQHLSDYEVTPLFDQFGRSSPAITEEQQRQRELRDFEGWLVETFKLRGRATKLGYNRGATGDGGWFHEYVKRFPTTDLQAVIEFTGNVLPEENRTAAMLKLSFQRDNPNGSGYDAAGLPLNKVPAVLLTECWNDFRQMAAEGPGFDPEWEKKSQY
jgi:hypothetical protein